MNENIRMTLIPRENDIQVTIPSFFQLVIAGWAQQTSSR